MDWTNIPALSSLRAFSAFATTGNVTQAGNSLNVSHAAISQQLRALERHLGVPLLDRSGRSMTLTDAGDRLARALELGFGAIELAVQELTGADATRPLHISTTPTFASNWLMPRLTEFRAAHPDIDLVLDPSPQVLALEPGGIDVALRYGGGKWSGLDAEPFLVSPMVIVAAPSLLQGRRINHPSDLSNFPWIEALGDAEASRWLRSKGVEQGIVGGRVVVPGNLLRDGARDGQGVAVMVREFVEPDLQSGRLIALFSEPGDGSYYIVTRPDVLRPRAKKFVAWLRRQRRASQDSPDI